MVESTQQPEEEFFTDPDGVHQPRSSFSEAQYTYEQLHAMKQNYLVENVLNMGYDPNEFVAFMSSKRGRSPFF